MNKILVYFGLPIFFIGVLILLIPSFETYDVLSGVITLDANLWKQSDSAYMYDFVGQYQPDKEIQLLEFVNGTWNFLTTGTVDAEGDFDIVWGIPLGEAGENNTFKVSEPFGIYSSNIILVTVGQDGTTNVESGVENSDPLWDLVFSLTGVALIGVGIFVSLFGSGVLVTEKKKPVKVVRKSLDYYQQKERLNR